MRLRLMIAALVLAAVLACAATTAALARVPQGFVGMNGGDALLDDGVNLGHQLDTMVASGVESLRVTFNWDDAQPYSSYKDLVSDGAPASDYPDNVGGVPTSFTATDQMVGEAAMRGINVLPVVIYSPPWDSAPHPAYTFARPARNGPFAAFMKALVARYGSHGTYWSTHPSLPRLPIRMWQIWNEPDISTYWPTRPWEKTYVALLHAAHAAIKSADSGAKVVLAGLPNYSWLYLSSIYKVSGARAAFDIVAAHPYTLEPAGVITILQRIRSVMNRFGDNRKPILATEVGWPSSQGKAPHDIGTTEAGQARDVAAVVPLLASNRGQLGLIGFDFYAWIGDEYRGAPAFNYSGLFRFNTASGRVVAKPAFSAFRRAALAIESCQVKATIATHCAKALIDRPPHTR